MNVTREEALSSAVAYLNEAERILDRVWPTGSANPTHDPNVANAYANVARAWVEIAALLPATPKLPPGDPDVVHARRSVV